MKNAYLQNGSTFSAVDTDAVHIHEKLPVGTYTINPTMAGYEIVCVDDMSVSGKLYGDVDKRAARILSTFDSRPQSTGVLLSGQKGSGKTMLTKRVSELARNDGVITILINQPLCGESFNQYLQSISQPAIVIFDEFEKVYDHEQQTRMLTIFDGTYSSKKLFMLTCNDRFNIDMHMHNRPGRIYYALEYGGLQPDFVREYCEDALANKDHINNVVTVGGCFSQFSFDMLKALVEEMNRYGESASEAMTMLNMKPNMDRDEGSVFDVRVLRNSKPVVCASYYPDVIHRNPLSMTDGFSLELTSFEEDEPMPEGAIPQDENYRISQTDLVSVDAAAGIFTYKTSRPDTIIKIERRKSTFAGFNYDSYGLLA